ncbi:hypothetical protein [Halostagnicola sp. A-GB9-2]|uniref:hypothetical protein n=1 Tax=Halostagnicola sp. A-GB9-2 TaxID=3048066 RepID=UPI0024C04BCD|nr:hypothetical protein [Halostagnicola sp. A-GB9-2]MDJ1430801.1 hypothetical protein [Halostagnicola sp. A-GB9-2]
MSHRSPQPTEDPPKKGILFCPECGHESAITGDWIVHEKPARDVYECPVCSMTILNRRRFVPVHC